MVFPTVARVGVKTRARPVAQYRVLSGVRLWSLLAVACVVAYIAACGYVYNLSRERHRLVTERNALRKEYMLLRGQREALRNPVRIQKQAKAYGMVPLTKPEAVPAPPVLAKRN